MAGNAQKISPQQAHQDMESSQALLVCGYDSDEKFQQNHLEGAISMDELRAQENTIPKDRELIFYCA